MVLFPKIAAGVGLIFTSFGPVDKVPTPPAFSGTVVTACGNTYTYSSDNVGVVNTSANGQTTSTVYVDGKAVLTETCPSGGGNNSAGNGPGGSTPPRPTPPTRPTIPTRPTPPRGPNQNSFLDEMLSLFSR